MKKVKIFHTSNSQDFGLKVASALDLEIGKIHQETFSDGEVFVRFEESIRGQSIIIVGQINMPYQNMFELYLTVDAAKRASAKEIICVIPYFPHSRQERKDTARTSIAMRVMADFIQNVGADRIMTIDLHSSTIEGFFKIPMDHLDTSALFAKHIAGQGIEGLCLCSPDFGGLKRVKKYKQTLDCDIAVIHKERLKANQVASMEIIGDVKNKHVIIIDDIIDTAGTLCKAADLIMESGAKSVKAYCTHGLFSGESRDRITASALSKVYVTDTISNIQEDDKIAVVSVAEQVSCALQLLLENKSFKALKGMIS